jgi:hypothetical protein
MEKLTETINAIKVSKFTKDRIVEIAGREEIQIQQVCRRLLRRAIEDYFEKTKNDSDKNIVRI